MRKIDEVEECLSTLTAASSTLSSYRGALTSFLKWSREHGYFTLGTASRYYEADLLRKGEVSAGTAKSYPRTVRAFCRWFSDEKKLKSLDMDTVPVINGELPSSFRKRIADCDLAYICSVLRRRGESGLREALMLLLAVTCSLSPEQISELMPEDLLVTEDGAWLTVSFAEGRVGEIKLPQAVADLMLIHLRDRSVRDPGLPIVAVRLVDGGFAALMRACCADPRPYLELRQSQSGHDEPLFVGAGNRNSGGRLTGRSVRGIAVDSFERAGLSGSAGDYNLASAAVELAVMEREPADVVLSLGDRTYALRKAHARQKLDAIRPTRRK